MQLYDHAAEAAGTGGQRGAETSNRQIEQLLCGHAAQASEESGDLGQRGLV